MMSLPTAFARAAGQLGDPAILRVLAKSIAVTLAIFAVFGAGLWLLVDRAANAWLLPLMPDDYGPSVTAAVTAAILLLSGWLLFRILAIAVIQFFADEIVMAVERRHYPGAHALARDLSFRESLGESLKGLRRAIGYNLLALPVALALLLTGIGTVAVFWLVNAVLLGRELQDMAWLRHRTDPTEAPPLPATTRLLLGGVVAALFAVPFANLLAPVVGAAAATHLVHSRRERTSDA
ncbi:EI24 domain-containing protein [Parerythrobacter aurantius]|uniref:EI24 domain-containing protein n=1 Tax=Parerythrobacter aurantius TaxID=3127706 RepID=UPI00324BD645